MNFEKFLQSWEGITKENRIFRVLTIGLVVMNIATAMLAMNADRTVVLVPPAVPGEVEIERDNASLQFKEAWAVFVAEMLGNVTPETADFVSQSLARVLSASIYRQIQDDLTKQIAEIKRDRVSISFYPKEVMHEKETGKMFVTGNFRIQGPGSKPEEKIRTYEMVITVEGYKPVIRHIDAYAGTPRTLDQTRNQQIAARQ